MYTTGDKTRSTTPEMNGKVATLHCTAQNGQYQSLVFVEMHAGISLQPLSTPTAAFSLCHVCTVLYDRSNVSMDSLRYSSLNLSFIMIT